MMEHTPATIVSKTAAQIPELATVDVLTVLLCHQKDLVEYVDGAVQRENGWGLEAVFRNWRELRNLFIFRVEFIRNSLIVFNLMLNLMP